MKKRTVKAWAIVGYGKTRPIINWDFRAEQGMAISRLKKKIESYRDETRSGLKVVMVKITYMA